MRSCTILLVMLFATQLQSYSQSAQTHSKDDNEHYFRNHVQPHSISALIAYCEAQWMEEEKDSFKEMPEKVAVAHRHYWNGGIIMSPILLMDSALTVEFNGLGITDMNDQWRIILTSLHRKLNNQDMDMKGQVNAILAKWKQVPECEARDRKMAEKAYKKIKPGNKVTVYIQAEDNGGTRISVIRVCPHGDWQFDPATDIAIQGVVTKKYENSDTGHTTYAPGPIVKRMVKAGGDLFVQVQVDKMNGNQILLNGEPLKIGDKVDMPLSQVSIK